MNRLYPLFILLTLGVWVLGILFARGSLLIFISPPALMIVVTPPIAMALACFTPVEILKSFKLAFNNERLPITDYKNARLLFNSLERYFIASGVVGFLLGLVLMLISSEFTTDVERFGRGMATSLLSILYAALFCIIITIPFRNSLQKKINTME